MRDFVLYYVFMDVLVVEDEAKVVDFISKGLDEEGYTVTAAYNGKQGLDLLKAHKYDIVLLDLMIPEIDGLKVLRNMRAWGINTPVLIITAKASKEDVVRGLDTGSDDYLTKPFSFEELLARIRALLRRSAAREGHTLKYSELALNPYSRILSRGPKEAELTEKEFLLLELMIRNSRETPHPQGDGRICLAERRRFDKYRRRLHKLPEKEDRIRHAEKVHPDGEGDRLHLEGRG